MLKSKIIHRLMGEGDGGYRVSIHGDPEFGTDHFSKGEGGKLERTKGQLNNLKGRYLKIRTIYRLVGFIQRN